eukprot:CAMPEP_0197034732 /NCGR_PEP_ID=MMETSP1384-20130603/12737_1 /TAXON_ID=29189 /ORGANISM="Ammonia sp." /LENGTH=883 /DNA_ID=CAMNT_0042464687 /DNA_START=28 /DNA_END=2679 /DNA_ORIENTATION=+
MASKAKDKKKAKSKGSSKKADLKRAKTIAQVVPSTKGMKNDNKLSSKLSNAKSNKKKTNTSKANKKAGSKEDAKSKAKATRLAAKSKLNIMDKPKPSKQEKELEAIKQETAEELAKLADENKDLFREKERLRAKYDDLQHEIEALREKVENSDVYKDENDRLRLIVENYKSEITALQTETIMLREAVNMQEAQQAAVSDANDDETAAVHAEESAVDASEHEEKLDAIKKLVREKNDLLHEFEQFKLKYEQMEKQTVALKKEVSESKQEVARLEDQLEEERSKYLEDSKRSENRINELNKKLKASQTELVEEYEKKEQQFIQTVEEQLKYIDELEGENRQLQTHHTRKVSLDNRAGFGMVSLLKLKTQANIFGMSTDFDANHNGGLPDDLGSGGMHTRSSYSGSISFDEDYDEEFDILPEDDDGTGHHENTFLVSHQSAYSVVAAGGLLSSPITHSAAADNNNNANAAAADAYNGYGTPQLNDMSSYLQTMRQNQSKEQEEMEAKEREMALKKEASEQKKEDEEREKMAAAQKRQTQLHQNAHLDEIKKMLKGKIENNKNDGPIEQTSLHNLGYFIDKFGRLKVLKEEEESEEKKDGDKEEKETEEKEKEKEEQDQQELLSMTIDEYTYEQLKNAITVYLFDMLLKYYKFKPKQIGKLRVNTAGKNSKSKSKAIVLDYKYKTLLFSSNFNKADTIFVIIPPYRGGIAYWNLILDKGIVYGSLISYIEFGLTVKQGKCGVLLLDPKGIDTNDTPYSIFKIYDKFLSKRIKNKKIKHVIFIGALNEGNLVSHLLDRRGKELKEVTRAAIFLCADDPYMTKPITAQIYQHCAVNYINSSLPLGEDETGAKPNGDKYIIPRKSAGIAYFGAISAYPAAAAKIKQALNV